MLWWNSLSQVWKKAFNLACLNQSAGYLPNNEVVNEIITCKVLRLVGPTGQNPTIDEPLQDLSGLRELRDLEILILTHHQIRNIDELEGLGELRTLFIHNNEIEDLSPLKNSFKLEELYCQSNNIDSLVSLNKLVRLHTLVCNHNKFSDFNGITENHRALKTIFALPSEGIGPKQIRELENLNIFCK